MIRNLSLSLLAGASALVFSQAALAEDFAEQRFPQWYVGLGGGLQYLDDADFSGTASNGNIDFDTGWIGFASLGYRPNFGGTFFDGFRIEFEGAYRDSDTSGGVVNGTPFTSTKNTYAWTAMGNLFYDMHNSTSITPYIGGGIGWAHVELADETALGITNESDTTWAYQGLAGLAYSPEAVPLTEWSLGYRYTVINDPEFTTSTGRLGLEDLESHNVEVGARFRF